MIEWVNLHPFLHPILSPLILLYKESLEGNQDYQNISEIHLYYPKQGYVLDKALEQFINSSLCKQGEYPKVFRKILEGECTESMPERKDLTLVIAVYMIIVHFALLQNVCSTSTVVCIKWVKPVGRSVKIVQIYGLTMKFIFKRINFALHPTVLIHLYGPWLVEIRTALCFFFGYVFMMRCTNFINLPFLTSREQ